jgi:hypothetical protein
VLFKWLIKKMDILQKVTKNHLKPLLFIVDLVNKFEDKVLVCNEIILALHHASLYDRIRRSEQKCKVALEVLSYHASCTDEEYERMKTYTLPDNIPNIDRFEYSPWDVVNDMKPLYVVYMLLDLANMDPLNANR